MNKFAARIPVAACAFFALVGFALADTNKSERANFVLLFSDSNGDMQSILWPPGGGLGSEFAEKSQPSEEAYLAQFNDGENWPPQEDSLLKFEMHESIGIYSSMELYKQEDGWPPGGGYGKEILVTYLESDKDENNEFIENTLINIKTIHGDNQIIYGKTAMKFQWPAIGKINYAIKIPENVVELHGNISSIDIVYLSPVNDKSDGAATDLEDKIKLTPLSHVITYLK